MAEKAAKTKAATKKSAVETTTKAPRAKKVEGEAGEKRRGAPSGPRPDPEGYVGLNTIANELGKKPALLRRKLRAAGVQSQSENGRSWHWKEGSKDLNKVREVLAA